MSNVERRPAEVEYAPTPRAESRANAPVQVVGAREVPLGGPRALTVRRTLPHRERYFVGAWCFADHYGPSDGTGMDVPPHPHTGLQTVSWLFSGEVEHRDSLGSHQLIRPGEMNLMTSGKGITHSEVSTPDSGPLHGVQLWVLLPADAAHGAGAFQNYVTAAVDIADLPGTAVHGHAELRVLLGNVAGASSPVSTLMPLVGAQITLERGSSVDLPVDDTFEHGVLVDLGPVTVDGTRVESGDLAYLAEGRTALNLRSDGGERARVMLLGGVPIQEEIVMWWNFVGRSHEEIVEAREQWQSQTERFGSVAGYTGQVAWLPAPDLPHIRLKSRGRNP